MSCLGFDTSNYTTSAALFDGEKGVSCARLLDVKPGELGLRQSDALFAHVQRLPELFAQLLEEAGRRPVSAVGVSTRPRAVEGSYMPCFLAGVSVASVLAQGLGVPLHRFSHQQGHIAAALWSAGRMELMDRPFLAWHLSGGTTELLLVEPRDGELRAQRIGGTTDISAGQLSDRTGKLLGLAFPAGKALDAMSREARRQEGFRVRCTDLAFSLSGVENQVNRYRASGASPADTAAYALRSVAWAVIAATEHALRTYRDYPVVFSGGVASNSLLRSLAGGFDAVFCPARYATDNAMGIAVLTWLQEERHGLSHL